MPEMLISVSADTASDSWGFVGVVKVGDFESYRTIEAFATQGEAITQTQHVVGTVLGELLAGAEWRAVRETTKQAPTRRDLALGVLNRRPAVHES